MAGDSNRSFAPNSTQKPTEQPTKEQDVQALFHDVFEESVYASINPQACIPFVQISSLTISAIKRLKDLFFHGVDDENGVSHPSLALGTDTSIVIKPADHQMNYVLKHFSSIGLS